MDKRLSQKPDKKGASRIHKRGIVGYSKKSALLEEAITHMNSGKYGRSSAALKELLALDPQNIEARRLFATLHLKLGSLVTARQAFESLANEAIGRQDYWLAESLLKEYLAAGPRCVPFLEQLAQVYQEKGDEIAAVVELGKAIEILRDDPDPEHPQKAAQLYSKIRELAPASSVAFQLAPLFDVQTGEFLVPLSATVATPTEQLPPDISAVTDVDPTQAPREHPLPEVMPWELTDEQAAALSPQAERDPSSPDASQVISDLAPTSPGDQLAEVPQPFCSVHEQGLELTPEQEPELTQEQERELMPEQEPELTQEQASVACESPIDEPVFTVALDDSAPTPPSGIPSPMPWEEMADASVQIPDAESPRAGEASSTLESLLASLRAQDTPPRIEARTTDAFDGAEPVADHVHLVEPAITEVNPSGAAPLSAPMPWEEISDPAIQITPPEPEFVPPPSVGPAAVAATQASEAVTEPQATQNDTAAFTTVEHASEATTSSTGPAEVSPAPSFSWNSVFDKTWNFTAGTMAPSPTVPLPDRLESFDEPRPAPANEPPLAEADEPPSAGAEFALEQISMAVPAAPAQAVDEHIFVPSVMETAVSPAALEQEPVDDPVCAQPTEAPPTQAPTGRPQEAAAHWNTGEVAVQVHRPSKKKKRWDREPEEAQQSEPPPEPTPEPTREWKTIDRPPEPVEPLDARPADERPDWIKATDGISFPRTEPSPTALAWSDGAVAMEVGGTSASTSTAAMSAVDVLFAPNAISDDSPSEIPSWSRPRPRLMARIHRVRIGISSIIGSCFSTTRSLTFLAVIITLATVAVAFAGIGAVAIMWITLEEPPSLLYQALTISPPRSITDPKKNGYLFLLGFDAPDRDDPTQVGYGRRARAEHDRAAFEMCSSEDMRMPATGRASDQMVKGWIRSGDLPAAVRGQGGTLKSLTSRESTALVRYQQWLTMSFDDWGFGQSFSPNCSRLLLTHRLFLLEGFTQDLSSGLDRLEADLQAWRGALAQAKTLPVKMLALTAVQDDASVISGLLSRQEMDGPALARLSKMVRPLDQVELSIRWPMQSEFVSATRAVPAELKEDKAQDRPWHASLAAAMRLPVQRRANAYAEYYDAANKAVAGGRYTNLPKASAFVRTPPTALTDYLVNPIEHIVGIEPLPSWEPFVYRVIETDAQLRLAGLQAWLRRGPQDGDLLMRLAKAGQAYYDPFTGLPMLVNLRKGVIYSVGRDGKDQEGDALRDVIAFIPTPSTVESRRSQTPAR